MAPLPSRWFYSDAFPSLEERAGMKKAVTHGTANNNCRLPRLQPLLSEAIEVLCKPASVITSIRQNKDRETE